MKLQDILTYKQRQAFELRYVEMLSVPDIARLTKVSDQAVKGLLTRAREVLETLSYKWPNKAEKRNKQCP